MHHFICNLLVYKLQEIYCLSIYANNHSHQDYALKTYFIHSFCNIYRNLQEFHQYKMLIIIFMILIFGR